jgi:hypothetical protein
MLSENTHRFGAPYPLTSGGCGFKIPILTNNLD